jgi:multiple sugar transport system ATP-binding protein
MLAGEVQIAEHLGGETFVYVALPSGETVIAEIKGQAEIRSGERVGIEVDAGACHVFGSDGLVIGRDPVLTNLARRLDLEAAAARS